MVKKRVRKSTSKARSRRVTKSTYSAQTKITPKMSFWKKEEIELHKLAHFAFLIGMALAVLVGIFHSQFDKLFGLKADVVYMTTFFTLGILVGLFNLTAKDTDAFLLAALALMVAAMANLHLVYGIGLILKISLNNLAVFVIPGALILAVHRVWKLASD